MKRLGFFSSFVILVLFSSQVAEAGSITVIRHGSRASGVIALTFDDCYNAQAGSQIRDILEQKRVNATLFCTASAAQANEDLMREFLSDGNEFGNHSISHPNLKKITPDEVRHEVCDGRQMLDDALGAPSTNLLRPPYGRYNQTVLDIASSCGYDHVILWDVDTRDWSGISPDEIRQRALKAQNGSIVIMHIGPANTPLALPRIIRSFRKRGYELVTVSQLIELQT